MSLALSEQEFKSGVSDLKPGRIKQRKDFLCARNGARSHGRAFVLQGLKRNDGSDETRFGFTVTKKIGNAVKRNRARRRLREAIKQVDQSALATLVGHDVVVIAKTDALSQTFQELVDALTKSLQQLVANGGAKGQKRRDHSRRKTNGRDEGK